MSSHIDFNETETNREIMSILLSDHTTNTNIMWCTDDYSNKGCMYQFNDEILIESITGKNQDIIKPRISKLLAEKKQRSKDMAEVFTPSWMCNKQNNLVDDKWFGYIGSFNEELAEGWSTKEVVRFPENRSWKSYVAEPRMEITCGEAPYLTSRYDTTTGLYLEPKNRIGFLDRKLRVVSENTSSKEDWIYYALVSLKSVYGYEFQGDSLLIARENLYLTFIDFYFKKFNEKPSFDLLKTVANVISWNLWQMDGLKMVVPNTCGKKTIINVTIFGDEETVEECEGCLKNDIYKHNGLYCLIMDWQLEKPVEFIKLMKGSHYGRH